MPTKKRYTTSRIFIQMSLSLAGEDSQNTIRKYLKHKMEKIKE